MPPWLLPNWVRERTLTMISAPGGVGKSNFATALGIHAATGRGFLGQGDPDRRSRVIYIAIDAASWDHAHVMRRLLNGMGLGHGDADPDDEWGGGFFFCFEPLLLQDGKFTEIMNEAAYGSGAPPDIVIVDSLSSIHDKDENKAQEMMPVMRFFRAWAEKNSAVVFLHHSKKPTEGGTSTTGWDSARGSGVLHNSVDTHIVLSPRRLKTGGKSSKSIQVGWTKGRGGDSAPVVKYKCVWTADAMRFVMVKRGRPPVRRLKEETSDG